MLSVYFYKIYQYKRINLSLGSPVLPNWNYFWKRYTLQPPQRKNHLSAVSVFSSTSNSSTTALKIFYILVSGVWTHLFLDTGHIYFSIEPPGRKTICMSSMQKNFNFWSIQYCLYDFYISQPFQLNLPIWLIFKVYILFLHGHLFLLGNLLLILPN